MTCAMQSEKNAPQVTGNRVESRPPSSSFVLLSHALASSLHPGSVEYRVPIELFQGWSLATVLKKVQLDSD